MSVNAITVQAIITNLIGILSDDLSGYTFEKDSVSPKLNTWLQLNLGKSEEEENHGEGPLYIEQAFEIVATRQIDDKTDHRMMEPVIVWDIKEAITVVTLNVGDLAVSKLVTLVEIESDATDYRSSEGLIVVFDLKVKFRDLRT